MTTEYVDLELNAVKQRHPIREAEANGDDLTASIRKHGLLAPVLVDRDNVLLDGHRRVEACRAAGLSRIPALRLDLEHNDMAALEIQVDMNLCRRPLTPQDLERLIDRKKATLGGHDSSRSRLRRYFNRTAGSA